jgi:predicted HNH restriction endonuclease
VIKKQPIKQARRSAAKERYKMIATDGYISTCFACKYQYTFIDHLHHIRPVAATNGNSIEVIWLCPTCHAMVHEIARLYISPPKRLVNREGRENQMDWFDEDHPDLFITLFDIAKRSIEVAA